MRPTTPKAARNTLGYSVLDHISSTVPIAEHKDAHDDLADKQSAIDTAIDSGRFHDAFVPLKETRDYYRGINSSYLNDGNGNTILIRDARLQAEPENYQCEASYYKYVQLGFNYLSGLTDLLAIEEARRTDTPYIDLDLATDDLKALAREYFDDITPEDPDDAEQQRDAEFRAPYKFGRFFHEALLPFYRQYRPGISDGKLIEELQLGRNFANMKVNPYAVATISRHEVVKALQGKTGGEDYLDVVELDLPMTELTEAQVALYQNRHNQAWYTGQSELARALIDSYTDRIVAGAMIPAQLIYHLIGTRNGYEKWTAALHPYNELTAKHENYRVINKTYHAGSQAHLLRLPNPKKGEEDTDATCQDIVDGTIDQLVFLTGLTETDHLSVNTLVTPLGKGKDARVTQQIQKATETKAVGYSNVPQNFGRRIVTRKVEGINVLGQEALDFLEYNPSARQPHYNHVELYLNGTRDIEKPLPEILELYSCVQKLHTALSRTSGLSDPDNHNLEIAAQANLLVHALNAPQKHIHYVLISGCFSGQDRGGLLSTHTSTEAGINFLTIDNPNSTSAAKTRQREIIESTQAIAGHTAEMAGNTGTGFGGEGIKPGSKDMVPRYYPPSARNHLLSATANFNEHIPVNPSRPFYKKKSFWIGLGLVVLGIGLCLTGVLAIKGILALSIGSAVAIKAVAMSFIAAGAISGAAAGGNYRYARTKRLKKNPYPQTGARLRMDRSVKTSVLIDHHIKNTDVPDLSSQVRASASVDHVENTDILDLSSHVRPSASARRKRGGKDLVDTEPLTLPPVAKPSTTASMLAPAFVPKGLPKDSNSTSSQRSQVPLCPKRFRSTTRENMLSRTSLAALERSWSSGGVQTVLGNNKRQKAEEADSSRQKNHIFRY